MSIFNEKVRGWNEAKSAITKSMSSQNALCQQNLNLTSTLIGNVGGMGKTINHSP